MKQEPSRKVFVEAGEPVGVLGGGDGRCRREGDVLVVPPDERWGNPVFADACLGAGDFHIHAKLSLDRLAGDGASILLGGRYDDRWTRPEGDHALRICLDEDMDIAFKSMAKQMRIVVGRTEPRRSWFPADGVSGKRAVGRSRDFIRPGEPFTIDLTRTDGTLTFSIDGREVFRAGPGDEPALPGAGGPVNFGFLPARGTLRIHQFEAEGCFPEPAFPAADIWRLNADGYSHYRTPALCTTATGRVLAFSEARRSYPSRGWEWDEMQDIELHSSELHCVMKHSDDGGRTWSEQAIVIDRGSTYDARFPAPLTDGQTGEIFLFMNGAWVFASRDDGRTWAGPRSLTGSLPANWTSGTLKSPVPGAANSAIQLCHGRFKGRLLMAFRGTNAIGLIRSDDHGKTWQPGALAAVYNAGDPALVECSDGRVLVSPRVGRGIGPLPAGRPFLCSHDGGSSFAETRTEPALPVSGSGAMLAVDLPEPGATGTKRPIVFCGAAESGERLALSVSLDDGVTWPVSRVLDGGPAGNVTLAGLSGGGVGVLYERDDFRRLSFQHVDLAAIVTEKR